MTCIKKIQNTEVFGSKFSSRTLTTAGDISGYTFKAVVKNIIQGKILEIPGIKNAGTINFDFSQLETLKKSTYQIEYWGDFGALGNEPFLLEEFSIVSAENATNCTNSDNLNFEIKIEEISIPVTITKAINNFSLNIENLTPEQIALLKGDTFIYDDFTPEQIAELQKPAIDKVVELEALEVSLNNSESLRVQNENTRISNEEIRNTNEIDRISSENLRQENEVSRIGNENERILAETERNDTETVRISNENIRISSENARNTNEQSRVNAENNRVTAENSRSSAENIRITAETERASNENERKTAETDRVSAENTRETAETSRASSESTRVSSENTRILNENNRISAENSRVTAESSRVIAENARVAAELERQQNKAFNIKVATPSSRVTGTTSETEVLRIEIPANSISDNSFLNMPILFISKIGKNGLMHIKGKLSTSPTMPTGTTDVIFGFTNIPATNLSFGMDRMYIISDGLIKGFPFPVSSYSSSSIHSSSFSSKPFDRTVTNYLYVSIQLDNTADQARLEGLQLTNS